MHMSDNDRCTICNSGEPEDLEHFLLRCPALEQIRLKFFPIFASITNNVHFLELSPSAKILFLVGDIGFAFDIDIGLFYDVYGRMYLLEAFNERNTILSQM